MIKRRRREVGTRRSFPCGRQAASGTSVRRASGMAARKGEDRHGLPLCRQPGPKGDAQILWRSCSGAGPAEMPAPARRAFRSSRCRDVCRTMAITTIEGSHQSPCDPRYLRQAVWHPSLQRRTEPPGNPLMFLLCSHLNSVNISWQRKTGSSDLARSISEYSQWSAVRIWFGLFSQVNAALGEDAVVSTVGVALVPRGITVNTTSL